MYICIYVYMYICIYVYMYICIYTACMVSGCTADETQSRDARFGCTTSLGPDPISLSRRLLCATVNLTSNFSPRTLSSLSSSLSPPHLSSSSLSLLSSPLSPLSLSPALSLLSLWGLGCRVQGLGLSVES